MMRSPPLPAKGPALVYVNVAWCGYCKRARPVMDKVSRALGTAVPTYDVDADAHPDLAKALGAQGYPTIVFIDARGRKHHYEGDRTMDAIIGWVCSLVSRAATYGFCRA